MTSKCYFRRIKCDLGWMLIPVVRMPFGNTWILLRSTWVWFLYGSWFQCPAVGDPGRLWWGFRVFSSCQPSWSPGLNSWKWICLMWKKDPTSCLLPLAQNVLACHLSKGIHWVARVIQLAFPGSKHQTPGIICSSNRWESPWSVIYVLEWFMQRNSSSWQNVTSTFL